MRKYIFFKLKPKKNVKKLKLNMWQNWKTQYVTKTQTQHVTKLKKLKMWQNSVKKCEKFNNSKCDIIQKLKILRRKKSKTLNVTKLKLKCDKIQNSKHEEEYFFKSCILQTPNLLTDADKSKKKTQNVKKKPSNTQNETRLENLNCDITHKLKL